MSNEESGAIRLRLGASYRWGQTATLRAKGGHNWVVNKAFECIRQNFPDQLPKDIDETYVHYGIFFADNPWAGRPESILNAEYPCGERCPSVNEDLWGEECDKDTGPSGEVHVRYQNKNDPNRPNLALMCTYEGELLWGLYDIAEETFAADNLSHYAHNKKVQWDGTNDMHSVLIAGPHGEGVWKIGAARYGDALYKLACSFWPGSSVKPRLDELIYVSEVGQISQLEGGGDLRAEVPATYVGGNPFILTHDGKATWPIWVPETYPDSSQLTKNFPAQSKKVAAIYLGWALHMLTDLAQPYHASDQTGKRHRACDNLYDALCGERMFDHLPLFGPGAKFKYSNRHVQDWGMPSLSWLKRYKQSNIAQILSNMGRMAGRDLSLVQPSLVDILSGASASNDQKLEAIEYLLNWALLDTIGMILMINQNVHDVHVAPWLSLLLEP